MSPTPTHCTLMTAWGSGAVAIVQLHGGDAVGVLRKITGVAEWRENALRLVRFGDIDDGLAGVLRVGERRVVQIIPHGGPRIVQRLLDALRGLGCDTTSEPPPRDLYPEARSDIGADALATIARAASPAAVDLLAAQPALWREAIERGDKCVGVAERTRVLDRLVNPPSVVVVGRPNVGKSTLANLMLGRAASLVADLPGTTRDWVGGVAELAGGRSAVAVRWLDTPGVRRTEDPIEASAIELAAAVIASADVLIAMRDHEIGWPDAASLPREPDMWVINKTDAGRASVVERADVVAISSQSGAGVDRLQSRVLDRLGLDDAALNTPRLWAFSDTLKRAANGVENAAALREYVQSR